MDRLTKNWAAREEARIVKLSNANLLEETLDLAGGDDYDGCFTRNGEVTYQILTSELKKRLAVWLSDF